MPRTSMHPNAIGNGSLSAVFTQNLTGVSTTDDQYLIGLSYSPVVPPDGTPSVNPTAGTVTVTGSGSANTATVVLRVENKDATGSANSDVVFTITVGTAKSDWSSGAATAFSVKDLIDLINEDDAGGTSGKLLAGFKAWINDARYDLVINGANALVTEAEKYVQPGGSTGGYTKAVPRDVSAHAINTSQEGFMKRIGFPEPRDRGLFKFIDIWGSVTGTTNGTIKIYRDDEADYQVPSGTYATDIARHEQLYALASASLSANQGTSAGVAPDVDRAECWRGPVVLEIIGDNTTACGVNVKMQAVSF